MSLLFPKFAQRNPDAEGLLNQSMKSPVTKLHEVHNVDPAELATMDKTLVTALLDMFKIGQRDGRKLARYAVSRVILSGCLALSGECHCRCRILD